MSRSKPVSSKSREDDPAARARAAQRSWATSANLSVDDACYVATLGENLFAPLSRSARLAYRGGSGQEFGDGRGRGAKMCALHSSSALVANVFDYWTDRDTGPLVEALGVPALVGPPEFEVKLPSGLPGTPPHLDVVLSHVDGSVTAIESKFTEWMSPKRSSGSSFSTSYFPDGRGIWQGRALPGCDSLASRLRHRSESFVLLDAAQLLKHILGLTKAGSGRFTLIYLYVDTTGQAGLQHREEIERFTRLAALGPHFRALTYEEMFRRLCRTAGHGHSSYIDYLGTRYFPDEPRNEEASE